MSLIDYISDNGVLLKSISNESYSKFLIQHNNKNQNWTTSFLMSLLLAGMSIDTLPGGGHFD